jgi:type II secretory pathway pseudopilin PulG
MDMKIEAGFSIVSILVALALISIVAVSAGQFFINSQKARKTLSAKLNYLEINDSILQALQAIARNPPASGCFTSATLGQQLAGYPFVNLSTQLAQGLTAVQLDVLNSARNASVKAAVDRCQTPQMVTNPASPSERTFYYCLRLVRDPGSSTDTITGSQHAFAEVKMQMVNGHSNQPVSCDNFRSLKQGAMQVYWTLYWSIETPVGAEYSQRNSYSHVSK